MYVLQILIRKFVFERIIFVQKEIATRKILINILLNFCNVQVLGAVYRNRIHLSNLADLELAFKRLCGDTIDEPTG